MPPIDRPWGLLTYSTSNLGDDIQSLAALHFLPGASVLLNRDLFTGERPPASARLILNGWWMHDSERLAAARCALDPMPISMHCTPQTRDALRIPRVAEFLRRHGPVGCRDFSTLHALERAGIPAWFSGCLTTTLPRTPGLSARQDPCLLSAGLPAPTEAWVLANSPIPVVSVGHQIPGSTPAMERLLLARIRLLEIERASAVVTRRIHVALPALALGVPVLLIEPKPDDPRLPGLSTWMHMVTPDNAKEALAERFANGWPANPTASEHWAATMSADVRAWVASRRPLHAESSPPVVTWEGITAAALAALAERDD